MSDGLTIDLDVSDLEPQLAADLRALGTQRGRPLRFEEVRDLIGAAEGIRRAFEGNPVTEDSQIGLLPREVTCGNVALQSPTMAAKMLFEHSRKWQVEPLWLDRWTAYVLAHCYDEQALRKVARPGRAADDVIEEWAIGLTCTEAELNAAIYQLGVEVYPPLDDDDAEKKTSKPRGTESS